MNTKKGSMMVEVMTYIFFSFLLTTVFLRFYVAMMKDYNEALDFFLETDYAYETFETLKVDLYNHRETYVLENNVLKIIKSDYINGNELRLLQIGGRLLYAYENGRRMELCHGLKDVQMRQIGEILFIKLIFEEVTYERAFHLAK